VDLRRLQHAHPAGLGQRQVVQQVYTVNALYLLFHQRAAHKGSAARQFNRNTCTRDSLMMDPPDSSLRGPWGGSNVTSVHVGFPLPWGGVLYIALCL
jgi:hypothetical protein